MDQDDIILTNKFIADSRKEIDKYLEQNKNGDKVIFLGITGAGKTILSCLISGKKVMIRRNENSKVVLLCEGEQQNYDTITTIPNIMFNSKENLLIFDCPGFQDIRGIQQEIVNAFSIDHLLESYSDRRNRIKTMLVISAQEIEAGRAQLAFQNFERLEKIFPNKYELEKGIGIMITKTDPESDAIDYIKDLSVNAPETVAKWCKFFIDHPEKVFCLPKAAKKNVDKEYIYNEKDKLIHFLKNEQMENPMHSISLSQSSSDALNLARLNREKKLDKKVSKIYDSINELYQNESDLSVLNNWSETLQKFTKLEIHDPNDLADIIEKYLPNNEAPSETVKSIREFEVFDSFINKFFQIESSKIQKKFRKKATDSIQNLDIIQRKVQQIQFQNELLEKQEKRNNDLQNELAEVKIEAKNDKDKMKQETDQKIKSMQQENDQKIKTIQQESNQKIESMQQESNQKIKTMQQENDLKIKSMQQENDQKIKTIQQESNQKIESMQQENDQKIKTIQQENNQKIESMQQENDQRIKSMQQESNQKIESMQQESNQKIKSMQQENDLKIKSMQQENDHKIKTIQQESNQKIESMQQESNQKIKSMQQENDLKIKSMQKTNDERIKAIQQENDRKIREMQKESEEKDRIIQLKIEETKKMFDKMNDYDITIKKNMTTLIKESCIWQRVYARPGLEEKELKGILSYLKEEKGDHIHKNNIIQITSNSIQYSFCMPENVIYYTDKNYYQSLNRIDSHICFDFLDYEVQIQSYLIKSGSDSFLKNWVLEGSNNNSNWTIIDTKTNDEGLKCEGVRCVFIPHPTNETLYRYIRLRQTGYNWSNNYEMKIVFMEFYGKLHKK